MSFYFVGVVGFFFFHVLSCFILLLCWQVLSGTVITWYGKKELPSGHTVLKQRRFNVESTLNRRFFIGVCQLGGCFAVRL